MSDRVPQSEQDIARHLAEEVDTLRYLCEGYDGGQQHLAKKIAVSLRLLLHKTRQSDGLLWQLKMLPNMKFFNAGSESIVDMTHYGSTLVSWQMSAGTSISLTINAEPGSEQALPNMNPIDSAGRADIMTVFESHSFPQDNEGPDDLTTNRIFFRKHERSRARRGQWINFDVWWNYPILTTLSEDQFSRSDLVLEVANTDGGAHVDSGLKDRYSRLTRYNSTGYTLGVDDQEGALGQEVWASLRAIAEEVLMSLRRHDQVSTQ